MTTISISYRITPICHAGHSPKHCFCSYQDVTVHVESNRGPPQKGTPHSEVSEYNSRTCTSLFRRRIYSQCLFWFRLGWWFGNKTFNKWLCHLFRKGHGQLVLTLSSNHRSVFNWSRIYVHVRLCTTNTVDSIHFPWMSSNIGTFHYVWRQQRSFAYSSKSCHGRKIKTHRHQILFP